MTNIKVILTPGQKAILETIRDKGCNDETDPVDCMYCPMQGSICSGEKDHVINTAAWLLESAK